MASSKNDKGNTPHIGSARMARILDSSADAMVDCNAPLHEQMQDGIAAASEFARSELPGQNLGGQNAEIGGVPQTKCESYRIVCSGLPQLGLGQNPDVSSLLLNSHGHPHIRQKTLVIQDASAYERFPEMNGSTPSARRWHMQKLQIFEDKLQSLRKGCDRSQIRHEFPDLPLYWSIAKSIMENVPMPVVDQWHGAYGTPSFWRWRAELVEEYRALKDSSSHLYVAHKSPDPVLFVLDMLVFCLANTFWLCSLHGMLMLPLINESTAPKQVVCLSLIVPRLLLLTFRVFALA